MPFELTGRLCALAPEAGFACYRSLFDPRDNQALLREAVELEAAFTGATVTDYGRTQVDTAIRSSRILHDLGTAARAALDVIAELARTTPILLGDPTPMDFAVDARMLHYGEGDFFAIHRDATPAAGSERLVSFVYQFFQEPAAFDGGVLRFYGEDMGGDPFVELAPENNLLTIFRPATPHEVMPIRLPNGHFAEGRFAINGWLIDKQAGLFRGEQGWH